VYICIYIYF